MKEIKNVAASIRQRLLNRAKKDQEDFQRTLVRFAVERFLYRLSQHGAGERFILKGAMLFLTWPEGIFRPTGDLDLLGHGAPDANNMKRLITEILVIDDAADGLAFDPDSVTVTAIREEEYHGVRVDLRAYLENAEIPMQIDVGFGDHVYPDPKKITFPCLLEDMKPPQILAYPAETVVAEKFEAMIRFGEATSRLKDFNDICAITKTFAFRKDALIEAIRGTCQRRETALPTEMPFALTEGFAAIPEKLKMWDGFLRRSPPAIKPPPFPELLADLRRFFAPLIAVLAHPEMARGNWDPSSGWSE